MNDKFDVIYVAWLDSGFSLLADRWQDIDDVKELHKELGLMETVGFLIEENDEYITLAQTINENQNQVRGGYIILKKNIVHKANVSKGKNGRFAEADHEERERVKC